jgi:hypothetical protein
MASAISIRNKQAIVALVVLAVAAPLTARAQASASEKQAQALQVEGLRLMQNGDNRHAIDKFDEAYRLVPSPRILFNRGKAHHALGESVEALSDLERFLDEAPFAPKESRDEATRVVGALRPKVAYIEVQTDDAGSEITLDLRTIGTAPLARPVIVTRGKHEIHVTKPGMNDEVRSVSVIPGQKLRLVIKLSPVVEKAPASPPPAPVATSSLAGPVASAPAPAPPTPAAPPAQVYVIAAKPAESPVYAERPWQNTAGWVAAGAGALFLGGGITAQLLSSSKNADFNAVTNAPNSTGLCNKMLPNDGGGPCAGLLDAAHQRQVFAIVGYVASGVAVATSLVFFLAAPSQAGSRHEVAAACSPSTSGASCALQLTF